MVNLDSEFKADHRLITKVDREIPFDMKTGQVLEAFYLEDNHTLVISNTGQLGGYRRFSFWAFVDMAYPRITLSTNSTEEFKAEMKIFLDYNSSITKGAYGFPFKIKAKSPRKFEIKPVKNISALKNGEYNLEEYLNITGPMSSLQQLTTKQGRLNFISRSFWYQTRVPDEEYTHIRWVNGYTFFGVTNNKFYFVDPITLLPSSISYNQEVHSVIFSCCSKNISFYALHYNPHLVDSLSMRMMDLIPPSKTKNATTLRSYSLKYIDSDLIPNIHLSASKFFLKSVADGIVALCIHDKHMVKILMIDYINKNEPIVTPVRDISSKSIGREVQFKKVEIISLMFKITELRAMLVVIGTDSHVMTQTINYDPSLLNPSLKTIETRWPTTTSVLALNGTLDYIHCEDPRIKEYKRRNSKVRARCLVVKNQYLLKEINFTAHISNQSLPGVESFFYLSSPKFYLGVEYEIPRFFEISVVKVSPDYIAIRAVNTQDYHKEILVYKRGLRDVWSSSYCSYESTSSFDIGKWSDGKTWIFVNEYHTALKSYLIGNMTLEVGEGYNSAESLDIIYSTYSKPSKVFKFTKKFEFAEKLVKKNNLILVVYGGVGGLFGVIIILWCCCCIWRCLYVCLIKRFIKREKRMVPILVKKPKKKNKHGRRKTKKRR